MENFTYTDVRSPAWAVNCNDGSGRKWLWCEILFSSGPQAGRWSAMVLENRDPLPDNPNDPEVEIYRRCVAGEFGAIAACPPADMPVEAMQESSKLAESKKPCVDILNCGQGDSQESLPND